MATKQPVENKFEHQDFDLFQALTALDKKEYNYYDKLTEEQKKKFTPFMLIVWLSCVKGVTDLQRYYVLSIEHHANKYMFNEFVQKHPKLQWLMLCAASPGVGKQFHQYLPHIKEKVSQLREIAKQKDMEEYFKKIYPKVDEATLKEVSIQFVNEQKRKVYLAKKFPDLKHSDIEVLQVLVTDETIKQYEYDSGNEQN